MLIIFAITIAVIVGSVLSLIAVMRVIRDFDMMLNVNAEPEAIPDNVVQMPARRKA